MRLVLLPGLNGSSHLFSALVPALAGIPTQVLELPAQGPQDHDSLARTLLQQLGETPFVLLGESFSGPIAHRLALQRPTGLHGVIFAASFARCPTPLLHLAQHLPLPLTLLNRVALLQAFCLGRPAPDDALSQLQAEISRLPAALVRARLRTLARMRVVQEKLQIPALHLWPRHDRLVSRQAAAGLANCCKDYRAVRLDGPHFILQTRASACAEEIRAFMDEVKGWQPRETGSAATSPAFP